MGHAYHFNAVPALEPIRLHGRISCSVASIYLDLVDFFFGATSGVVV